jgi:hypothetical protein
MTDTDLLVLIPWAIAGAVLILICVRIHVSSGRRQSPRLPAGRVQPPGMKPADDHDPAPPDLVSAPDRRQDTAALLTAHGRGATL